MNVGSLFSGIGGIELGFERAGGFEVKWFVENDLYAQAVLRKHWKNVPIYGDIKQIDFTKVEPVDVLTGGFPCQDISIAGKGAGINGSRSGLWKEYFRAIGELRPGFVFVENVSALTYRGLLTVLGNLASVGYDAEWHCVPASALGAPHRRDRIYIMAYVKVRRCDWKQQDKGWESERSWSASSGRRKEEDVSHSQSIRGKTPQFACRKTKKLALFGNNYISTNVSNANNNNWEQCKKSLCKKNRETTWATDTGVLRVANGVSNRVDRIKCLGNAVVPQCAEFFAEIIKEKEKRGN